MAVDRVSVTVPTAVSVGSKVDIVCSWDNADSPPRHPVVRLTGGDGTEKTGLKLTETSQNQKKCTQQTNKILENRILKITNPFCFYGHIHEATSYIIRHHPSLVNGRRLSGIVNVALSEVAM